MSHVRGLPVPVPPTGEQQAILQQLEEGLRSISETYQAIDAFAVASATLRQSILTAAFCGDLA